MSVSNSSVFVNMPNCYVYSKIKDDEYVRHLKFVAEHFPKYRVAYSLGNVSNYPMEQILSMDTKLNSVFLHSYQYVPCYTKIEGSFLWCHPRYKTSQFENKFIAVDANLEMEQICHLLRILIPPNLKDTIDLGTPLTEIKHYAECSTTKSIYLK